MRKRTLVADIFVPAGHETAGTTTVRFREQYDAILRKVERIKMTAECIKKVLKPTINLSYADKMGHAALSKTRLDVRR